MQFSIYPPIGIARLGNSDEFFIGPERPGSAGTEAQAGSPEVTRFKDSQFRFRKQACRFHLVQSNDDGTNARIFVPAAGDTVEWSVRLVNAKDAIARPPTPPSSPVLPIADPARANRRINSGAVPISGTSATVKTLQGTYLATQVILGAIRTDAGGRLVLTGGNGRSESPEGAALANEGLDEPRPDAFYNNRGWFDDVGDGPVTAKITLADNSVFTADPAWVIVGPPDAARSGLPVTTLYDVIRQVALDSTALAPDTSTSFTKDIYPMLANARSLRWTHVDQNSLGGALRPQPHWTTLSTDYATLSQAGTGASRRALRQEEVNKVLRVQGLLRQYRLRNYQLAHLDRWVAGTFASDWQGVPTVPGSITPEGLLRSALDSSAGQGFFPGIEAGRIVTLSSIYQLPFAFRFNPAALNPGDITALMALPWQADFFECALDWWPTQRPDLAPQTDGTFQFWTRPFTNFESDHRNIVENVMRFGTIKTVVAAGGAESAVEEGRDPTL